MRGGFCHNEIMTGRLRQVATECGAATSGEHPVLVGGQTHYIDLLITQPGQVTACEPESSPARVDQDVLKADAVGASRLLIATLDAPTAHACRRRLRRLHLPKSDLKVIICPLGAALEILRTILTQPTTPPPHERKTP